MDMTMVSIFGTFVRFLYLSIIGALGRWGLTRVENQPHHLTVIVSRRTGMPLSMPRPCF